MLKFILTLLLAICFTPNLVFGCTCAVPDSFCNGLTSADGQFIPDIIVRGTVMEDIRQGGKVAIHQVLYGFNTENELELSNTNLCAVFLHKIEVGSEYIFALAKSDYGFHLLTCAISFLKIDDGFVVGNIAPGIDKLSYNDFINFNECGVNLNPGDFAKILSIYPNPARDEILIENTSEESSLNSLTIKITDALGRNVTNFLKVNGIMPEENMAVNISNLARGIYIVEISDRFRRRAYRIVKQ